LANWFVLFVFGSLAFDLSNVVKDEPARRSGKQDRNHASGRHGHPTRVDEWFGTFDIMPGED
jgi:hypothetical protein